MYGKLEMSRRRLAEVDIKNAGVGLNCITYRSEAQTVGYWQKLLHCPPNYLAQFGVFISDFAMVFRHLVFQISANIPNS